MKPPESMATPDIAGLGQVFTPEHVVAAMLRLRGNHGATLEPAAGAGVFSSRLPGCVAVEIDPRFAPPGAIIDDFFALPPLPGGYATIIGNPPYVRHQDIPPATRARIFTPGAFPASVLDKRGNLYLYFIERCLHHLAPGGELIFITPRDFLKTTSATALNQLLYAEGTITHAIELGDAAVFADAVPNCLIWRFVRGDFTRQTKLAKFGTGCRLSEELAAPAWTDTCFLEAGGHLLFSEENYPLRLADIAYVKVGAVSGADDIYRDASLESIGNRDFVCSETERTGKTRRMLWCGPYEPRPPKTVIEYLLPHRDRLIRRGVRAFHDGNWWEWGRGYPLTRAPRVYVNGRTRAERPFFLHPCLNYDGAVLAIFPHDPGIDLVAFCAALNNVHWADLGFVCDGRHLFTQRSLENSPLPASFSRFLPAAPDPATPAGG